VALLDALAWLSREHGFVVVAAHLDHGLRPDSAEDAAFCEALSAQLGVRCVAERADVAARARRERQGIEAAARAARYEFLRRVKDEVGAIAIAVAHTRDDQAETFLIRLLRGAARPGSPACGSRAATCCARCSRSRARGLAHLAERGLAWREAGRTRIRPTRMPRAQRCCRT
jgi:tRNA(Ile)-lysidine synthase